VRSVFWFLALAAVAVALALLVGGNQAIVSVFWHPYRIDLSFNMVLLGALVAFALLHAALRGVALLRGLPQRAQRWRAQQHERALLAAVLDALAYQMSGRFVRARGAAQQALQQLQALQDHPLPHRDQAHVVAHLMAAESAHALGDRAARDLALAAAIAPEPARHAPEAREGALIRAAAWAVRDQDPAAARRWLAELPQGAARRIQTLRVRLKLARVERDNPAALDMVRLLAKHKAFTPAVAGTLLRGLATDALRETHDGSRLWQVWRGLEASERQSPGLALVALDQWVTCQPNDLPSAEASAATWSTEDRLLLEDALRVAWDRYTDLDDRQRQRLVLHLERALPGLDGRWLADVEQAQLQHPADVALQYLAGQVFLQRQLWGKAAHLLGLASARLPQGELARRAWCSVARLAEHKGDSTAALQAWKRAAGVPPVGA
jgi:HemY protein